MPEKVRQLLEQVGDNPIIKIQLGRTPVKAAILLFLNVISNWKFKSKQCELGYDEIYHNYLLITIQIEGGTETIQKMAQVEDDDPDGGVVYKLEKAQRVRLVEPAFPDEFVDIYDIPLTPDKTFTLNRLITAASNVDKQFYVYDAGENNMCQTFVENIVDINGLSPNIIDNKTRIALKPQDARALVATLGSRSDIVKRITDLGGTLDTLVSEGTIKWKIPVPKKFVLFGSMHVKKADGTEAEPALEPADNDTENIIQDNADTVTVDGMTDTVVENTDDMFDAIVELEAQDKAKKSKKGKFGIIIAIVLVILLVVVVAAVAFFMWKKRKDKLAKNDLITNVIEESTSNTSLGNTTETPAD